MACTLKWQQRPVNNKLKCFYEIVCVAWRKFAHIFASALFYTFPFHHIHVSTFIHILATLKNMSHGWLDRRAPSWSGRHEERRPKCLCHFREIVLVKNHRNRKWSVCNFPSCARCLVLGQPCGWIDKHHQMQTTYYHVVENNHNDNSTVTVKYTVIFNDSDKCWVDDAYPISVHAFRVSSL